MRKSLSIAALSAAVLILCSCTAAPAQTTPAEITAATPAAVTEAEVKSEYTVDTDLTGDYSAVSDAFEMSDGWTNGSMFNCTWRKNNCTFDGTMKLTIDNDPVPKAGIVYSSAEFRTKDFYGFGYYEVEMKPIKNDGVVSSFFTYTGPSDDNPWDEIDIEFLGKDTTKVQFNYFTDGTGGHEHIYDLGFDASEEFHTYGFNWAADSITWYVDGKEAYTADKSIPQTPSKIMMNVWPGTGVDGWLNAFDGTVPLSAEYKAVKFKAAE